MELAFRRWEPKEIPAGAPFAKLVFLHGMGGTGALWRPIAAFLEERAQILAPDQRGHGRSAVSGLSTFHPLDFGNDLVETLDAQDFHPAWLIGHSMGVRSACAAAHLRPDWVQGLILIDLGFSGPAGGGLGERLAAFLEILPQSFPTRTEAREFMTRNAPDPSMGQYLMAVATMEPDGRLIFPFDKESLLKTLRVAGDTSVRDWVRELGKRGMPILALRGALSQVWSRADFEAERALFSDLPSVRFQEIEGTGHGLPFDKRTEFLRTLEDFINLPRRLPTD
ncbi:MAG: alpha/beta hydrolase [Oligoflexia bacterium]|nr:alpha/beta hydrolase [Oligoflexia bacterium]